MDSTPVASIELPRRVPWGFHALFVGEEEVGKQLEKVQLVKGRVVVKEEEEEEEGKKEEL